MKDSGNLLSPSQTMMGELELSLESGFCICVGECKVVVRSEAGVSELLELRCQSWNRVQSWECQSQSWGWNRNWVSPNIHPPFKEVMSLMHQEKKVQL